MSHFVKHEPCPSCGSRDNLGRYSDGGAFCFGCHYIERANIPNWKSVEDVDTEEIQLPRDVVNIFPEFIVEWLAQYDIHPTELLKYGVVYSPHFNQLIFPYRDERGILVCTQARNFTKGKPKYYNAGKASEVLPIFGDKNSEQLVITEDALSSLKIGRQGAAMPCLGTYLPSKKIIALGRRYKDILVWLDSDKWKEAVEIGDQFKWMGVHSKVIYSNKDPKEYSDDVIKEYLK